MIELNKIYCMDNVQGMRMLDNECIDLTVTSPPYDNLRQYNGYSFDFKNVAKELYRVTKQGGVVVWVVNDATIDGDETCTSFRQALFFREIGFKLHDTMIYAKTSVTNYNPSMKRYKQSFEYMFVFAKDAPKTFNPIQDKPVVKQVKMHDGASGRDKNGNLKKNDYYKVGEYQVRFNVWHFNVGYNCTTHDKIAFKHPAIFPEQLVADHIKSWSNEGDIVLDPFMGSGTTAKVARELGRKFIGFEISEEYVKLANKRLDETKSLFDE